MFKNIISVLRKPKLYEKSTAKFWDDEHISKYMLQAHLDSEWDAATRNYSFVEKSVNWIASILPPDKYCNLLDLGCGPGIYAEKFYEKSYRITGVDLSIRSIEYAKANSILKKYSINYINKNYLDINYNNEFNLVTLIYCDFGVLSTDDRRSLLKIIYSALKPGGAFVFDVFTPKKHKNRKENTSWEFNETGFYSDKPHLQLNSYYRYDDVNTFLDQSIVITESSVECYNIWDHTFTIDELTNDLKNTGFTDIEFYSDVAGKSYDANSTTICAVAKKGVE